MLSIIKLRQIVFGRHSRDQQSSLVFHFCIPVQPASSAVLDTGHVAVRTIVTPKAFRLS